MTSLDAALEHVLRFGPAGLLIGPEVTAPGWQSQFSSIAKDRLKCQPGARYIDTVDNARGQGIADTDLLSAIRAALDPTTPGKDLALLAGLRWSSVLSMAIDHRFEALLIHESDRHPQRPGPIILEDTSAAPPPRGIPVYKLLGSIQSDRLVMGSVEYLRARAQWRRAAREFSDRVKAGAVICVGFDDLLWGLHDLLAELLGARTTAPAALVVISSERTATDPTTRTLVEASARLLVVDKTLPLLISAIQRAREPRTGIPTAPSRGPTLGVEYAHIIVRVNDHITTTVAATERRRLRESLFSPTVPRWDAYCHNLDLKRTVGDELASDLLKLEAGSTGVVTLTGNAATGKTTVLKRLAFTLAKAGRDVLWFKRATSSEWATTLPAALRTLHKADGRDAPVFAFIDDPYSLGSPQVRDVWSASLQARVPIVIVVGARTSDWSMRSLDTLGSAPLISVDNLPDDLDELEWAALPAYLQKLEIVTSQGDGARLISETASRHARDTLSMLYWLLPETRSPITSSVKDEYLRLGDMAAFATIVIGERDHTSEILKTAYGMVAVANHYRAPLPVEVLVGALGVSYREWLDACAGAGNGWGLLYEEPSDEDGTTMTYRTRNDVITRILLETINLGVLGHSGEVAILEKLLGACTGSNPVYRDFCVQVLVRNNARDNLDYGDGVKLFSAATQALPFPDKTLVHHRAIWIREKGRDPLTALKVLDEALATPTFPYAKRVEVNEHVYTSIAATTVDALDKKAISVADAKSQVLANLGKARSSAFFNPNAVHVQAGLIVRLLDAVGATQTPDSLQLMAASLADIDQTLLSLRDVRARLRSRSHDVEMLEEARNKIVERSGTLEDLLAAAESAWQGARSQQGFVVACRRMLLDARNSGRGGAFNKAMTYAQKCIADVRQAGSDPAAALYEVTAQILYEWRITGAIKGEHRAPIDWAYLVSLVYPAVKDLGTPLLKYLLALAYAHLLKWPEANALFTELRRSGLPSHITWAARDYLLDDQGTPRSVQGVMRHGIDRWFIKVDELQTDLPTEGETWPREGEIARAYVEFAFGGPTAIRSLPQPKSR